VLAVTADTAIELIGLRW